MDLLYHRSSIVYRIDCASNRLVLCMHSVMIPLTLWMICWCYASVAFSLHARVGTNLVRQSNCLTPGWSLRTIGLSDLLSCGKCNFDGFVVVVDVDDGVGGMSIAMCVYVCVVGFMFMYA